MGNVTYAVSERVRRVIKYSLIGLFLVALVSPFFLFSNYGASKIHDWAVEKGKPGALYTSARLHCIMGTLSPERYPIAEGYFEEYLQRFPEGEDSGLATYYIGWCLEEQKKFGPAKRQYEIFVSRYPGHEKVSTAEKALNRIEAYGIHTGE